MRFTDVVLAQFLNKINTARSEMVEPSVLNIKTTTNLIDYKFEFVTAKSTKQPYCVVCKIFGFEYMHTYASYSRYEDASIFLKTLPNMAI